MYSRILIATDGSDLAGKAVEHGLQLAKTVNATVVFVTVTEIWSALDMAGDVGRGQFDPVAVYEKAAKHSAQVILEDAAARASSFGVASESRHVSDRKPAEGILETADLEDCDLIIMASHGRRGVKRMLLGSQTAEVTALSNKPVLVVR